jgi:hypothetical protein
MSTGEHVIWREYRYVATGDHVTRVQIKQPDQWYSISEQSLVPFLQIPGHETWTNNNMGCKYGKDQVSESDRTSNTITQ